MSVQRSSRWSFLRQINWAFSVILLLINNLLVPIGIRVNATIRRRETRTSWNCNPFFRSLSLSSQLRGVRFFGPLIFVVSALRFAPNLTIEKYRFTKTISVFCWGGQQQSNRENGSGKDTNWWGASCTHSSLQFPKNLITDILSFVITIDPRLLHLHIINNLINKERDWSIKFHHHFFVQWKISFIHWFVTYWHTIGDEQHTNKQRLRQQRRYDSTCLKGLSSDTHNK